jgi:hypothetical protein
VPLAIAPAPPTTKILMVFPPVCRWSGSSVAIAATRRNTRCGYKKLHPGHRGVAVLCSAIPASPESVNGAALMSAYGHNLANALGAIVLMAGAIGLLTLWMVQRASDVARRLFAPYARTVNGLASRRPPRILR